MKVFTIAVLLKLTLGMGVNAQLVVQGKVMDSLSQPVPFANVLLLKAVDSLVTGGAVSDSCGMFVIAAKLYELTSFPCLPWDLYPTQKAGIGIDPF